MVFFSVMILIRFVFRFSAAILIRMQSDLASGVYEFYFSLHLLALVVVAQQVCATMVKEAQRPVGTQLSFCRLRVVHARPLS